MAVSSTVGNIYMYNGTLAALQAGSVLNVGLLNALDPTVSATFIDNNGILDGNDDGITTVSFQGGPEYVIGYIGSGTAALIAALGLRLFSRPVMAFEIAGQVFLHFPNGLPPLSGLAISFDIDPDRPFNLPNPTPICLTAGTLVQTGRGAVAVEDLVPGDLVATHDHGLQPLRWIGQRAVGGAERQVEPRLRPVRIAAGALGYGLPDRPLLVSQQHRLLVRLPGSPEEVLIPARLLIGQPGITLAGTLRPLTYLHLLFDRHEIITAAGCAVESLYLGGQARQLLPDAARAEIAVLFPELMLGNHPAPEPARRFLTRGDLRREGQPPLQTTPRLQAAVLRGAGRITPGGQ